MQHGAMQWGGWSTSFILLPPAPAGYLSSYEDIVSTSRPVAALAADGSPIILRQALLPLVEEILRHRSSSGSLAASVAAPPSPMAASAAGAVQSLPGTPVARSSSMAEDGGGVPAAQASTDAELPVASEASGGQLGATEGEEASSSSTATAAAAATPAVATGASDGAGNAGQSAAGEAAAGEAAQAGEAAALLERAATDKRLLIGGTCPPLDTPLAWLHAQLHAPDFFLYAVLHLPLPR